MSKFKIIAAILLYSLLILLVILSLKTPQHDRDWVKAFAKTPQFVETETNTLKLENLRLWEFAEDGPVSTDWGQTEINPDSLSEIWFFLEPFSGSDNFGHTFLSFVFVNEFEEQDVLSVSVEARREVGEDYSAFKGLIREYELTYSWSTEKDILTRIAIDLGNPLYAFKVNAPKDSLIQILESHIERTNELAQFPRFYNTLGSNCTNELGKAVHDVFPDKMPWHLSWVMTGKSAAWLHKNSYLQPTNSPYEDIYTASNIGEIVNKYDQLNPAQFSAAWRIDYQDKLAPIMTGHPHE